MELNLANWFEAVALHKPEHIATIHEERILTWRMFEDRAARLAGAMAHAGLRQESKIGIYLHNCSEYLESMLAVFKIRAVPINVNYRYERDELAYLIDNADLEGLIFHARYSDTVRALADRFPALKFLIVVDDDSGHQPDFAAPYERTMDLFEPMAPIARSGDDLLILYTGGTTGMPKGVMYRQSNYAKLLIPPLEARGVKALSHLNELPRYLDQLDAAGITPRGLPVSPLMHGTALAFAGLMPLGLGGSVVTIAGNSLDASRIWATIVRHEITSLAIVGDAFSRALVQELQLAASRGAPIIAPRLRTIMSSGAMWSYERKAELLHYLDVTLVDGISSTEGGMGNSIATRSEITKTAAFQLAPGVKVFNDLDQEVRPGSNETGRIAVSNNIPLGYYKDPKKTAQTFREIDGVRYSFPGDYAKLEANGKIILLGRGSGCINTAGEKVFPEEVEETLKKHAHVVDAAVFGMADEKYGQRVVAVVSVDANIDREDLLNFARGRIAGFKLPKQVFFVGAIARTPSGKIDYAWARLVATGSA